MKTIDNKEKPRWHGGRHLLFERLRNYSISSEFFRDRGRVEGRPGERRSTADPEPGGVVEQARLLPELPIQRAVHSRSVGSCR
jgi:hypothetical protein